MQFVDNLLNKITMYRLVLYGLSVIIGYALLLSFFSLLPFDLDQLISSLIVLSATCYAANFIFSRISGAVINFESSAITTLILFLILAPMQSFADAPILITTGVIAMLSKYVLSIYAKHIFNPAAIAVFIIGLFGSPIVIWWVGSAVLLPVVLVVGLLIVRKIRRFQMVGVFFVTAMLIIVSRGVLNGFTIIDSLTSVFTSWPIVFFMTIMLTEPLTSPPMQRLRIIYGFLVGIFFSIQFHFGPLFSTPEFALIIGNVLSYLVSSKQKLFLQLRERKTLAPSVEEFRFALSEPLQYRPGQYLEWTIPDKVPDSRGNRRYFTIASSPTEKDLKLGVRVNEHGSSFKQKLLNLQNQTIVAGQLAGDFVLPEDKSIKLVFIAGGIGITPFRSMIKYLVDTKKKRSIILLYANKSAEHIVYKELFDQAAEVIGLQTYYIATDKDHVPGNWKGLVGRPDSKMLTDSVPDYKQRMFYLSGPNAMVNGYKKLLLSIGIKRGQIITDYFPGY